MPGKTQVYDSRWFVHPDYRHLLTAVGIKSRQALYDFCGQGEVVAWSSTSCVWQMQLHGVDVYIKKYEYASPSWRYFARRSRGFTEFLAYRAFGQLGIPCPPVLCFAEKKRGGRPWWAVLITEAVANSMDLFEFLQHHQRKDDLQLRMQIMEELGHIIAILHRHNFFHRDFKLRNILWKQSAASFALYLIDCPRGSYSKLYSYRAALWDLVTLYKHVHFLCSSREWQIFLKVYARQTASDDAHWDLQVRKKYRRKYAGK